MLRPAGSQVISTPMTRSGATAEADTVPSAERLTDHWASTAAGARKSTRNRSRKVLDAEVAIVSTGTCSGAVIDGFGIAGTRFHREPHSLITLARYPDSTAMTACTRSGVDAVPLGGGVDDVGERPLAGLGRAREEAVAGGDEQQEHEATAGETRRHGERATYHIKGRTPR